MYIVHDQEMKFPKQFCVVGTDTGVGKTVISAVLARMLNASYWKPVQAGFSPQTDRQFVADVSGLPLERILSEGYLFERPMAPALAATLEGKEVDLSKLVLPTDERLVVEGVGGILTPLNDQSIFIDLLKQWQIPALIVSRSTLGTINHTLLTLNALRDQGIPIVGVIMNGPRNESNRMAIEKWGRVNVIAEMTPVDDLRAFCKDFSISHV